MISTNKNKDNTIHGKYKSKEITLKLLFENKKVLGDQLKKKIELFQSEEEGVLTFSSECKKPHSIKLEKENNLYKVSLTKSLTINKENMTHIENLLLLMADQCTEENTVLLNNVSSFTNLLHTN